MDVGIVGLAGSGRSTVFRALLAHRAPSASGDRHSAGAIGIIHVQDPRLERLTEIFKPKKVTPAELRIHDLCPSLEPSFPSAELEAMKRMDLLLLVLPAFADPEPKKTLDAFDRLIGELCLEDLAAVERRLARHPREKLEAIEKTALEKAQAALEAEQPIGIADLSESERAALRGYSLITDRGLLAVRNTAEDLAGAEPPDTLVKRAQEISVPALSLCAALEEEMAELPPEERPALLSEYGVEQAAGAAVTLAALEQAKLIPFYTVGEDECRAWPIARGTTARSAAGKIHSDIERGFIRAEVVSYEALVAVDGQMSEARKQGTLRLEGKDYVVRDGEIVHFRFNV